MPLVRLAGLLILLLTAGCGGGHRAPQVEFPKSGAIQEKPPALEPQQAVEKQEKTVIAKPAQTAPKQDVPIAVEPAPPPAVPPATAATHGNAVKPEAPVVKPAAKAPASPPPPAPKKENAVPPAPKPTAAPLDLASLEKRLKETDAIGVFTKLTLKNQVDDLLNQFRAYYQGRVKTTLAALRQPYDQLLLKVLSLLQDGDPPLARAITESREAIWGILSDPEKFKSL